jgi:predicted RNase H-like HicB family nuclease
MEKYAIVIYYSEEDEGWVATLPDFKYCTVVEDTPEEAVKQLLIAQELWLESAEDNGIPIPEAKFTYQRPPVKEKIAS